MATYGPYAATKFALEAVSDSLRREVGSLGVKVVVIEPGAVTTAMLGRVDATGQRIVSGMTTEQRGRYCALMQAVVAQAQASVSGGTAAEDVATIIADSIASKQPRSRYTVGRSTAMIVRLIKILPDRMLDKLLAHSLQPYLPK